MINQEAGHVLGTAAELLAAAADSHDVVMLFVGLASAELHIARVAARVARGGHDIPLAKIRECWINSRINLIELLPRLAHLQVFDNSVEALPGEAIPDPVLLLEMARGVLSVPDIDDAEALRAIPD